MSFGFGVNDFVTVLRLANDAYAACRDGPGEYKEISSETKSLRYALKQLSEDSQHADSLLNRKGVARRAEFLHMIEGCESTLTSLLKILDRHSDLLDDGQNKMIRTWHAYQIGSSDLDTIRGKLTFHTGVISMFLISLEGSAISRMESKLDRIYARLVREDAMSVGASTTSVASTTSMVSQLENNEEDAWQLLRQELLAEDVSSACVSANKDELVAYLKALISVDAQRQTESLSQVTHGQQDLDKNSLLGLYKMNGEQNTEVKLYPIKAEWGVWAKSPVCLLRLRLQIDINMLISWRAGLSFSSTSLSPSIANFAPKTSWGPMSTTNPGLKSRLGLTSSASRTAIEASRRGEGISWRIFVGDQDDLSVISAVFNILVRHDGQAFIGMINTGAIPKGLRRGLYRPETNDMVSWRLEPVHSTKVYTQEEIDMFLGPETTHLSGNSSQY